MLAHHGSDGLQRKKGSILERESEIWVLFQQPGQHTHQTLRMHHVTLLLVIANADVQKRRIVDAPLLRGS